MEKLTQRYFELQMELGVIASKYGLNIDNFRNQISQFPPDVIKASLKIMREQLLCIDQIILIYIGDQSNIVFLSDYR